jgi:hypothetical protein
MNQRKEFTRQELYDLVWSTPMVKLAKGFGLSDAGLRKICVKHDIPTPPLGYWAKLNFGKPVKKPALGTPREGVSDRIFISTFIRPERPEAVADAELSARQRIRDPIIVPTEIPSRLHPIATALRQALRAAKPDGEGFIRVGQSGVVGAAIGRASIDRAVLIVDTAFKTLEATGQKVTTAQGGVNVIVNGEALVLQIAETKDKKEHEPTKGELKAQADWEERRAKWPTLYGSDRRHWRTWDYFASGRLSLSVVDPLRNQWQSDHLIGRWHDRKTRRLEDYMNEMVVAMFAGSAIVRHNRIEAETAERRRQEAHEAYVREQERLRIQARMDTAIQEKADVLQRIAVLRDYLLEKQTEWLSRKGCSVIGAIDDLIGRLERTLSGEAFEQGVHFVEEDRYAYRI